MGLSILYFSISDIAILPNSYPLPNFSNCSKVNLVEERIPKIPPLIIAVKKPKMCMGLDKMPLS